MALAGALRADQQHDAVRPVRPTLDQTQRYTAQLQPLINKSFPETDIAFAIIGFDPMSGLANPSGGMIGQVLKPWNQRSRSAAALAAEAIDSGRAKALLIAEMGWLITA